MYATFCKNVSSDNVHLETRRILCKSLEGRIEKVKAYIKKIKCFYTQVYKHTPFQGRPQIHLSYTNMGIEWRKPGYTENNHRSIL